MAEDRGQKAEDPPSLCELRRGQQMAEASDWEFGIRDCGLGEHHKDDKLNYKPGVGYRAKIYEIPELKIDPIPLTLNLIPYALSLIYLQLSASALIFTTDRKPARDLIGFRIWDWFDLGFGIYPILDFRSRISDLKAKRIGYSAKKAWKRLELCALDH